MRRLKLLALAALALFAFGAMTASAALATETEPPELLCLEAKCAKELVGKFKGEGSTLFDLLTAGLSLVGTGVTATIEGKLCVQINGVEEKDCSLWKDVPIDFTGVKNGKVACRSEATNGTDKDASTFANVAKPEVCISRIARVPPIQAPALTPRASSSRVQAKHVKNGSASIAATSGRSTLSGT